MLDYVDLEADLGEEERLIRDTAREFVEEEVRPGIAEHFEAGTFPTDLIPEMGEMGFYRLSRRMPRGLTSGMNPTKPNPNNYAGRALN